ncbi:hypothetical protein [Halorussus halophilus]|uniref:hypothetical protein n=1 Tax=Halorussus halophilus TaxID=2650975 RepID=UPI001CE4353C|nr:hypothetical protein [Halorussus halophilus]
MTDNRTRRPATRITTDRDSTGDRNPITNTMGEVSHNHPYTARGAINRPFERGPVVAADGGRRDAGHEKKHQMKDVDHTPPHGEGAKRVFERGGEGEEDEETEE